MSQEPDDIKRWTARRKAAAVMAIIKGKTTAAKLARTLRSAPKDMRGRRKGGAPTTREGNIRRSSENSLVDK